uniref:Sulfatase N-terminal domain-containing protein n=1 Tax=Odontella aurita TaxID=265563 RepID=A0A7S4IJP2_9STRA|mmetsp:Transcript_26144/g.77375  ORF Transcript_26144/g.77375 Transcript_26144/m.77375 type:complete len:488 (+) Transcript_26144:232-1695(+)
MTKPPWRAPRLLLVLACLHVFLTILRIAADSGVIPDDLALGCVLISVDGLKGSVHSLANYDSLDNFRRLFEEGACTEKCSIDSRSRGQTLPSHTSMLTGQFVLDHGKSKDGWSPGDPLLSASKTGGRERNIFDAVAASGRKGCLFSAKEKFRIYDESWNGVSYFMAHKDGRVVTDDYLQRRGQCDFSFVHFKEVDNAGHKAKKARVAHASDQVSYWDAVMQVDGYLGDILDAVEGTDTCVFLTADHGFGRSGHGDLADPEIYNVPCCVWGPGVTPGADLYDLNPQMRKPSSGSYVPGENASPPPIRNHDAARVVADFLGVSPALPSSLHNDIAVSSSGSVFNLSIISSSNTTTTSSANVGPESVTTTKVTPLPATQSRVTTMATAFEGTGPAFADYCSKKNDKGDSCTSDSECCSNRCRFKKYRGMKALKKNRGRTNVFKQNNWGRYVCFKALVEADGGGISACNGKAGCHKRNNDCCGGLKEEERK